jgi:hypothetical protein
MVHITETARRNLVVTGFVLLCLLPTLAMLAWIVRLHWPGRARAEARQLEALLGLRVSLEEVEHLSPGRAVYKGLQLSDPETGQGVLRCRRLETDWQEAAGDDSTKNARLLILMAESPEINGAQMPNLWRLLNRQLTGRSAGQNIGVRLSAAELTVHTAQRPEVLEEVHASLDQMAAGTQARLSFLDQGQAVSEPATIRIGRNRQTTPPATGFELYTGTADMPGSLLALGLPAIGPLGDDARFHGYIWANQNPQGWAGELTGQWTDVELDRLITDHFPHTLSGLARMTVERIRFADGRVEEASGTVSAGPGMVSRSMLQGLARHLNFEAVQPTTNNALAPYEQLAFSFSLNAEGLEIQGQCPGGAAGTVMLDRRSRLLSQPPTQPQPVPALLQALFPPSRHQMPALRQTSWLARRLPLPEESLEPIQAAGSAGRFHHDTPTPGPSVPEADSGYPQPRASVYAERDHTNYRGAPGQGPPGGANDRIHTGQRPVPPDRR